MAFPVKIINHSSYSLPQYETEGSSGMDLRANIRVPVELRPFERRLVATGLSIELPQGFEAQVRPRSGMALKQGITCLNSPGTVDSDYRGEIKVILINLSGERQFIQPGDRIAQLVVQKTERVVWQPVEFLEETNRSGNGFGSTGKQ
ncbi:MAG TPA: dUTP diphosphatase [Flavisolibacter sp.]|nr:dUTP diphosphatase [Flavisolibacter sp.]